MFLRSDAVPPNLQVDQRLQPRIYLSSSTLEAVKRPLREYGYNTGIQSGTDLIEDGIQGTANHLDVAQHVRTCGSADCKSNHQVGCRVLSVNRHRRVC